MINEDPRFEDIDSNFLNFKPSTKLPAEVKERFEFHFNRQKNSYLSRGEAEGDLSNELFVMYWDAKFVKVFSQDCEGVWQSLYENDKEATIKLANSMGRIGLSLYMSKFYVKNSAEKVESILILKEKIGECLS